MFNFCLCNTEIIWYSLLKFRHTCMHLCGKDYKYFSPHCCKCNSFGCIAAIRCGNACHGPHSASVYSGSEHRQFNSTRLPSSVKWASPTHDGRWLAQTNYGALMTHHITENMRYSSTPPFAGRHGLNFSAVPAWISNYVHYKMWDEITLNHCQTSDK